MNNVHAETNVIGALIAQPQRVYQIDSILKPEHFWTPLFTETYREICRQVRSDGDLSPQRMIQAVSAHPSLMQMEGHEVSAYFAQVMSEATQQLAVNFVGDAKYIVELYERRRLDGLSKQLQQSLAAGDYKQAEAVKAEIQTVNLAPKTINTMTMHDQLQASYGKLIQPNQMMLTGIKQWDKTFGGLSLRSRYIIAAYGGAGKTALAAQIATNVAMQGHKVRYMLFEETPEKIWARVAANRCRVSMREIRNEEGMTLKGQRAFMDLYSLMEGKDMLFLESPQTLPEMIDLCQGADLIVVDGVSDFPAPPELTKIDKAGWVSDQCAKISRMTGAAVLMLSHVNSDAVKSGPSLAGIYGGQAASFDPEGIMEIRRTDPEETGPMRSIQGLVLKNRYGEVGVKMKFKFEGEYMTYHEDLY